MKLGLFILLGSISLLTAGYFGSSWLLKDRSPGACAACQAASLKTSEALGWMRKDYGLNEQEFKQVCTLHDAYLPLCDKMCQRMAAAAARLSSALEAKPVMTPEVQSALHEYEEAEADCRRETLQHLLKTAAVMKPEAARSFVKEVMPHLLTSRRHVSDLQQPAAKP